MQSTSPDNSESSVTGQMLNEVKRHLLCTFGYDGHVSEKNDADYLYRAAAATMRDRLSGPWRETRKRFAATSQRKVHYLSLEFLLGRSLNNAVQNLNLDEPLRGAIEKLGLSFSRDGFGVTARVKLFQIKGVGGLSFPET